MGWGDAVTDRQLQAYLWWQQAEWNAPNRTDHYLMMLIGEVIKGRLKKPKGFDWRKLRIPFEFKQRLVQASEAIEPETMEPESDGSNPFPIASGPRRLTKQDIINIGKARAMSQLGVKPEEIKRVVWGKGDGNGT